MTCRASDVVVKANRRRRSGALAILLCAGIASCSEVPQTNASEEARIEEGLNEVAAGQARSDINVAEVQAREKNKSKGDE